MQQPIHNPMIISFYSQALKNYFHELILQCDYWNIDIFLNEANKLINKCYNHYLVESGIHYMELVDDELPELRLLYHLIAETKHYTQGSLIGDLDIIHFQLLSIHGQLLVILK